MLAGDFEVGVTAADFAYTGISDTDDDACDDIYDANDDDETGLGVTEPDPARLLPSLLLLRRRRMGIFEAEAEAGRRRVVAAVVVEAWGGVALMMAVVELAFTVYVKV